MTTDQEKPVPFRCPRCGGAMYKPAGSAFYWHADYNHPRCEITNLADSPKTETAAALDEPGDLPAPKLPKKKRP